VTESNDNAGFCNASEVSVTGATKIQKLTQDGIGTVSGDRKMHLVPDTLQWSKCSIVHRLHLQQKKSTLLIMFQNMHVEYVLEKHCYPFSLIMVSH